MRGKAPIKHHIGSVAVVFLLLIACGKERAQDSTSVPENYSDRVYVDTGGRGGYHFRYVLYERTSNNVPDHIMVDLLSPMRSFKKGLYLGESLVFGQVLFDPRDNCVRIYRNKKAVGDGLFGMCVAPVSPETGEICLLFKKCSPEKATTIRIFAESSRLAELRLLDDVYVPLVIPLLKEKVRITIQDDDQTSITFDIKNSMNYRSIQERNAKIVKYVLRDIANFDKKSPIKRVAVNVPQALASIDYIQGGLEIAWETSNEKLNLYYDEFCSAGVAHKVYANSFTLDDHSTISARRMVFIRSHDVGRAGEVEWLGLDNDADFCDRLIKGDTLWFGDGG